MELNGPEMMDYYIDVIRSNIRPRVCSFLKCPISISQFLSLLHFFAIQPKYHKPNSSSKNVLHCGHIIVSSHPYILLNLFHIFRGSPEASKSATRLSISCN